jgi:hypothetical protein
MWVQHVALVEKKVPLHTVHWEQSAELRSFRRSGCRGEDNIKMDLERIGF